MISYHRSCRHAKAARRNDVKPLVEGLESRDLAAGLAGLSPAVVKPAAQVQAATVTSQIPTSGVYSVTLSGIVSNRPFTRTAVLVVTPTMDYTNASGNGVNPLEIGIFSGNPSLSPSTGAIQFATNTWMLGSPTKLDVSYVTVNSAAGTVDIQMDPRLSRGSVYELFNASSGQTANVYAISAGNVHLSFQNGGNTISGTAYFQGQGFLYGNATYLASISGTRLA